jgi:hypothetical protein
MPIFNPPASTAIPAIKDAIFEILKEATEGGPLANIKVTDDKEPDREKEYVWVWKAQAKRAFKLLGPQPARQEEMIKVFLRVVAIKGSEELKPSEERALEIFKAVEEALRADITLKGNAFWHLIEDVEIAPVKFDKKRGCHVIAVVAAKARI